AEFSGNNAGYSGTISFTQSTSSAEGILRIFGNNNAFGNNSTIMINNTIRTGGQGTKITLYGGVSTPASVSAIFNSDTGPAGNSFRTAMLNENGSNTWNGPITLVGATLFQF